MKKFSEKVLELTGKIPSCKVTTYSEIARALGNPKTSRAVGNALNKNQHPEIIPCYRVVRNDGSVGGFALGPMEKIRRLKRDGIVIKKDKIELEKYFHSFRKQSH